MIAPDVLDNYKFLESINHPILDALYPKKLINAPEGYFNPKYYPVFVAAAGLNFLEGLDPDRDETQMVGYAIGCRLAEYNVPTYFVDYDLLHALNRTTPPEDFLLKELNFPFPAMLFCIPDKFALEYLGVPINFISICKSEKKDTFVCPVELKPGEKLKTYYRETQWPGLYIYNSIIEKNKETGVSGTAGYSLHVPINDEFKFKQCLMDNITYFGGNNPYILESDKQFDPLTDSQIANKLNSLALRILLLSGAVPEYLTQGECVRKEKIKHNKKKSALYTPSFLGKGFVISKEKANRGGTHASPIVHWRKGHWTRQPYGPQASLRKLIWIRPVWIGGT